MSPFVPAALQGVLANIAKHSHEQCTIESKVLKTTPQLGPWRNSSAQDATVTITDQGASQEGTVLQGLSLQGRLGTHDEQHSHLK